MSFLDVSLKLIKALNNSELSYDLGVISQLIYKNSRAHRCQKYFQALKKIDRHMYEFSSLKLLHYFEKFRLNHAEQDIKDVESIVIYSVQILKEVENNCLETVRYCLPQINTERFVPLHTLHVNVASRIWKYVKELIIDIEAWLKVSCNVELSDDQKSMNLGSNITTLDKRNMTPDDQLEKVVIEKSVPGEQLIDLGQVISRESLFSNTPFQRDDVPGKVADTINNNFLPKCNDHETLKIWDETEILCDMKNGCNRRYSNSPLRFKPYHISFLKHCFHHTRRKIS